MIRLFVSAVMSLFVLCAAAQDRQDWEEQLYDIVEAEDIEADDWENITDFLADLAQHPLNINTVTRDELSQIPFLTDRDIEALCAYIDTHGGMKTLGELAMTGTLDAAKQRLLSHFVYVGDTPAKPFPSFGEIMKNGRHTVVATGKVPFYSRRGDRDGYQGYKYKHDVRYTFNFSNRVKAGITGAQDAGEPFFAGKNRAGYDYYSFYVMLKGMGRIKTLIAGNYRVGFGMGLVANGNFSMGKLAALASLGRTGNVLRPHSSRSEQGCLQGAAATVNITRGLDVTAFASYRKIDATLNSDKQTISTILHTGYHRTQTEMDKKGNTAQTVLGTNVHFSRNAFHLGVTAVYTALDRELKPKTTEVYRRHYASGNNFWNISAEYAYTSSRLSVRGETATGGCGALATANAVTYGVLPELDLMILQRFYSYKYYSLLSRGFSEGGSVQNESGVYAGADWHPSQRLHVTAYLDFARFAWPKYRAAGTSQASDNFVSATYKIGRWTLLSRYRLKMRQYDNKEKTSLTYKTEHRARATAEYAAAGWSTRTQVDFTSSRHEGSSRGWMVSHAVKLVPVKWLKISGTAAFFKTDDYDSRLYLYEQGMLYSMYFPSFYGKGMRYALFARADLSHRLMIAAKLGTTKYFDRDHIGSGRQQIDHSSATDAEVQLRVRL